MKGRESLLIKQLVEFVGVSADTIRGTARSGEIPFAWETTSRPSRAVPSWMTKSFYSFRIDQDSGTAFAC